MLYNLYYSGPRHGRHERIGVEMRAYSTLHYVYTVICFTYNIMYYSYIKK
jgi:hypothetical protein